MSQGKPRVTCAGCPNLSSTKMMGAQVFHCQSTEYVVPHHWEPGKATFWRIPMSCPLPATEVVKSETKAPQRDWVTISTAETPA